MIDTDLATEETIVNKVKMSVKYHQINPKLPL